MNSIQPCKCASRSLSCESRMCQGVVHTDSFKGFNWAAMPPSSMILSLRHISNKEKRGLILSSDLYAIYKGRKLFQSTDYLTYLTSTSRLVPPFSPLSNMKSLQDCREDYHHSSDLFLEGRFHIMRIQIHPSHPYIHLKPNDPSRLSLLSCCR